MESRAGVCKSLNAVVTLLCSRSFLKSRFRSCAAVSSGTVTRPCWAIEFVRNGVRSRRRAALRWMPTTRLPPASRSAVRAGQTGIRSACRFAEAQVPSWGNGAQADFLCGTVRHGQRAGVVRVISRLPEFQADGTLEGVDTFRIDLCQEVSGYISVDDLADC